MSSGQSSDFSSLFSFTDVEASGLVIQEFFYDIFLLKSFLSRGHKRQ